ncbi:MAG TPA: DEAD/DEAH box helicase, partial [Dehalococcoidia bacterium]
MDYPFAALALTVTGPDPGSDRILEVAAVRHDGRRFHALTNPGTPVPYRLRLRLGLDEAALAAAPPFEAVARELAAFLDGLPLASPDADRDVTFLRRHGLPLRAPAHDVRELASLFLPAAGDLGLRALARALGLPELPAETAEERARAVRGIFPRLLAEAAALPPTVLAEVERLGSAIGWGLAPLFQAALEEALARTGAETEPMPSPLGMEFLAERGKGPPGLTPRAEPLPVTREEAAGVLEAAARADGPRLERRPEQLAMAGAVAEALSSGEHLLVEAGTGTGKSLAYLVPAAVYALRNSTRVAISTNTINLQEQLTEKDIPALRRLLAEHGPPDVRGQVDGLRAVQLKGRRNYLCLQRWAGLRRAATFDPDEARFLLKLSVWLGRTQTGDRGELSLAPQEEAMWSRVNAQNVNCFAGPCPYVKSGRCFLLRAKRRAETAHLLVVNHALLLSDVATGGYVLPPYEHLVVDEAHNLEEEATQQFGFSAGAGDLTAYLDGLAPPPGPSAREGREGSLVTSVEHALRGLAGALPVAADLRAHCAALAQRVADARARLPEFFGPVEAFARENQEENGEYDNRVLLTHAKRSQPAWLDVELAWENLLLALEAVEQVLLKIQAALAGAEGAGLLEYEELLGDVVVALQQGQGLRRGISRIVHQVEEETVAWLTVHRRTGHVSLASAPLFVGDILRDELFAKKDAVILTSATLTTGGRFDYVKQRLGL